MTFRTFTARVALCLLTTLAWIASAPIVSAVPAAFNTRASGNWNADTTAANGFETWDPGAGVDHLFPIAGDSATISHAVTLTSNQEFGGPGTNSGWNALVNINLGNNTLTQKSGDTFTIQTNNARSIIGTGPGSKFLVESGALFFLNLFDSRTVTVQDAILDIFGEAHMQTTNSTWTTRTGTNGEIRLNPGAAFRANDAADSGTMTLSNNDSTGKLTNNGGTFSANNLSNLVVNSGTGSGSSVNGTYEADAGRSITFQGRWSEISGVSTGSVAVTGLTPEIDNAVLNVTGNGMFISGTVSLDGKNLINQGDLTMSNHLTLTGAGGTFTNAGTLLHATSNTRKLAVSDDVSYIITGTHTMNNNEQNISINGPLASGTVTVGVGGTLNGRGEVRTEDTDITTAEFGVLSNLGTVEANLGQLSIGVGGAAQRIEVAQFSTGTTLTGGTWKATNTTLLMNSVNGNGILTIGEDATVVLTDSGAQFAKINDLTTVNGTFLVNGTKTFNSTAASISVGATGTVGGTGTFSDQLDISGTLAPGQSAGQVTLNNNVTFQSTGALEIEIGGTTPGTEFDVVVNNGALDLGEATLDVSFIDGFELLIDDSMTFEILNGVGSVTGVFGNTDFGDRVSVAGGFGSFLVTITGGSNGTIILSDFQTVVIPEPGSLSLLACGALGLVMARRRKRGTV